MAFVSSVTLSYWRCAFLLTIAFLLIKSPETIIYNTYILFFAHVFNNVVADTLAETKNLPVVGIIGSLLALNALSDLVAIFSISNLFSRPPILDAKNMRDIHENEIAKSRVDNKELYFTYFENLVPLRLLFFFALTGYSYISENPLVANNLVSTYGFIEIWFNFVIFNNLREEKVKRYKSGYFNMNDMLDRDDDYSDEDEVDETAEQEVEEEAQEQ
ncbi:Ilm1 protein [Saccharomycopsis crataegensis]|uniref:Ilm1 protein n=1 Tax=Saccharomycopsis crataegensis TaxID=43959 RepID=A0AAV5QL37_9ASCO|nr:Ilm1 protein [Saccharomycopsis crataegensis]